MKTLKKISALLAFLIASTPAALSQNSTYIKGTTLIESVITNVTASGTTTLTANYDTNIQFTGTLDQIVQLPDATLTPLGRVYNLYNDSTGPLTVKDFGGSTIATVLATSFQRIVLLAHGTSSGIWIVSKIGSGSGGSGSGGINYVLNPGFETATTGYVAYADAAGAMPVNCVGGSPTTTITRSTSNPLRGSASGVITKTAANLQGEGISYDFTIDNADLGKPLHIGMNYLIASGTFATGDYTAYIYDVTNTSIIQPTGFQVVNTTAQGQLSADFQTASNSTSYRLCLHTASTSASAYTIKVDNISVGPSSVQQGAVITDWVMYTPTFVNYTVNGGSTFVWSRRNGDSLEVQGTFNVNTPVAAVAEMSLGFNGISGSVVMDTSKMADATVIGTMGSQAGGGGSAGPYSYFILAANANPGFVHFGWQTNSQGPTGTPLTASNVFSAQSYSFYYKVPIAGWSANLTLSDSTPTQVLSTQAALTSNYAVGANAVIKLDTVIHDSTGTYSPSTGLYTVTAPGSYRVSFSCGVTTTTTTPYIVKSGTPITFLSTCSTAAFGTGSETIQAVAGDTIGIFSSAATTIAGTTAPYTTYESIDLISGPQQIAASEFIGAKYTIGANLAVTANTAMNFDTKIFDTHGAVTPGAGTWIFTAPSPGTYSVSVSAQDTGASQTSLYLTKSGSTESYLGQANGSNTFATGTTLVRCIAGDTLSIKPDATQTWSGGSNISTVSISRVGSY